MQASREYRDLAKKSQRELEHIFVQGERPDVGKVVGWEYRGYNHPAWMKLLGIKKFVKGFFQKEQDVYGCNSPVRQNALEDDWLLEPDETHPKRFGFYRVAPVDPTSRDNAYLHAVLLDYGAGGNKPWDMTRVLRDYVVRVERGSDDLLLGKAYLALGPARPATSFFLLERHRPYR